MSGSIIDADKLQNIRFINRNKKKAVKDSITAINAYLEDIERDSRAIKNLVEVIKNAN